MPALQLRGDGWLGEILGRPVFRLDGPIDVATITEELSAHVRSQARAFYFAKIDCARVDAVRALGRAGFFVADVNVTFERASRAGAASQAAPAVEVSECTGADDERVLRIAKTAFRYTRFHLDPLIGKDAADEIKRAWVASYIAKTRGDRLFVARTGGRAVGFLAALRATHEGRTKSTIDLVAVDSDFQRRNVGRALVDAFAAHYRDEVDVLAVGTQIANVPSIRLYERLGFTLARSEYVLHLHARDGRPEA